MKNEFRIEGDVVWIKLTQGQETCIDLKNWEKVSPYKWYAHKRGKTFYAVTKVTRVKNLRLHQLLLGVGTDHEDRNGLNNLEENLRPASQRQNCQNQSLRSDNTSGFKGVSWISHRNKWRAYITVEGTRKVLGSFSSKEEAAAAYDKAARENFGEFAAPNI